MAYTRTVFGVSFTRIGFSLRLFWTVIRSSPEIRDQTMYSLQKNWDRTACGPVFFTVSKKGSGLGLDRTVASLVILVLSFLKKISNSLTLLNIVSSFKPPNNIFKARLYSAKLLYFTD